MRNMFDELKLDQILRTLGGLRARIEERFPGSGLGQVAGSLHAVGEDLAPLLERARRPRWLARGLLVVAIVFIGGVLLLLTQRFRMLSVDVQGIGGLLQAIEAAAQDLIFLSLATYFLFTIDSRVRRRASLRALHRLRSIVHIVDMHQLTKDPEHLLAPGMTTASSPERRMTRFELARYLDYCSELLSIASKLAALHAQYLNDPVVLAAVTDVETLASNLANKMWQKIVILDTAVMTGAGRA
jgi:hypothetical protein